MIGLLGSDPYWQAILRQEGTGYVTDCLGRLSGIAVLVVDRMPSGSESAQVETFARSGGAVLASAEHGAKVWPDSRPRHQRLRYVVPDGSPLFRNVGLVDLETVGWRLPDARYGLAGGDTPAVSAGQRARGWVVLLPFDLARVVTRVAAQPRQFLAQTPRFPTETVSAVGRGDVRRLVANCLRWLLSQKGLPYVHLSYVLPGQNSVFGFRVDTDSGSRADLEATVELSDRVDMQFSWYVNTSGHGGELDLFRVLKQAGHDIGLHCHRHVVYPDFERNLAEFGKGRELMSDAGIAPRGVVAPYGEWNQNLEQALAELGFEYSSEFGYAYDDLPARPGTSRGPGKVMQVPVHPVSAGRLIAARAVNREIVSYYQTIIDEQVARREPCFLYDHPTQVARMPEVWAEVLEYGRVRCGGAVTLTDYASWWRRRESINLTVKPLPNGIEFAAAPAHADVSLVVEVGDRRAELPLRSGQYDLDRLVWTSAPEPVRPDPLVSELRRSSLRLTLREWRRSVEKHLQSGRG